MDFTDFTREELWTNISPIFIKDYYWIDNGYKPTVDIRIFHTQKFIYVKFKVYEKKVTILNTKFGSNVYNDSSVEFFFNPFPAKSKEYFNIEINAIGIPLIGVGENNKNNNRYYFKEEDVKDWEIIPSIKKPITGLHGNDFWALHYKIPKSFFENYYECVFKVDSGLTNFYKCGDETEFKHFGSWNKIDNQNPTFHVPEYFGIISFDE